MNLTLFGANGASGAQEDKKQIVTVVQVMRFFCSTKSKIGVSRANVARCMIEAIDKDEWIHKMPIVFNR